MTNRPKRRAIPLSVKIEACLLALGLDPKRVHWHHEPPLVLRPLNADGTDTDPPMNDPRHIVPMASEAHKERTPADLSTGAKVKRLEKQAEEFRNRLLAKERPDLLLLVTPPKRAWPKGRKLPSRPFPTKQKDTAK